MVSGKFFPALGTQAGLGRTINEEDNQLGGDNKVVVLRDLVEVMALCGHRFAIGICRNFSRVMMLE